MQLMAVEQDDRIIWVVVEQHRPRGASAAASSSTSAGTGTAMRLKTLSWSGFGQIPDSEPSPNGGRERRGRALGPQARARFLFHGVSTGGIAAHADDLLLRREAEERRARERARAASWPGGIPSVAFAILGIPTAASLAEIRSAYRGGPWCCTRTVAAITLRWSR